VKISDEPSTVPHLAPERILFQQLRLPDRVMIVSRIDCLGHADLAARI